MNRNRLRFTVIFCFCVCFLLIQLDTTTANEPNPSKSLLAGVGISAAVATKDKIAAVAVIAALDSLWDVGERTRVMTVVDSLLALAQTTKDSISQIDLLTHKGRFSRQSGDPVTCENSAREALALAAALNDSTLACAPQRWLAVALTVQGRHDGARREYERLLELANNVNDHLHQGWANIGLGWDADLHRNDSQAKFHYERAATLFEKVGDSEAELWASIGCANALFHMAEYDSAGSAYRQVIAIAKEVGLRRHEALTLNNLAGLLFALGRPDLSEQLFVRAIALWDSLGEPEKRVAPSLNRGSCLGLLGLDDEASALFDAELAYCRKAKLRDLEARVLRRLAGMESKNGRPLSAENRLNEILALGDELPVLERTEAITELALLMIQRGECVMATGIARQQRVVLESDATSLHSLRLDLVIGRSLICLERYDEALENLRRAHRACGDANGRYRLEIEPLMADCFANLGERDSTLFYLTAAADLWEKDREMSLDPAWREELGKAGKKIYTNLAWEHLILADTTTAFNRIQHYKARTLQERMRGPGKRLRDAFDETTAPLTLDRLQQRVLHENEMLLDSYLGPDHSLFFAVTRNSCRAICLPGEATLVPRLQRLYELLSDQDNNTGAMLDSVLSLISNQLCGDLYDLMETSERIILCPDGILNLLPPECLSFGVPKKSVWARVPSASILRDLRVKQTSPLGSELKVLVLMGGENEWGEILTGAKEEVDYLASTYRGVSVNRQPVSAGALMETPFYDADLLHVAAHAKVDDNNSWQSAIVFGPEEADRLRAADLAEMTLSAHLVVLSSCSSARGRILSGEGVLGLASAFIAAGVPAVVASLWPVDDLATARFMKLFYAHLAAGLNAATALQKARIDFRAEPEVAHPFYWAGFILIGNGETVIPLVCTSRLKAWQWILGIAVLLAGLIGVWRYRSYTT